MHTKKASTNLSCEFPTQCHANKEEARSALNKYLDCLGLPPWEERKNIGDRCLNNIFSQEGFPDIFNHPGRGSGRKFCALVVAFDLFTRQVGNRRTRVTTLVKASLYCMAKGDVNRFLPALVGAYASKDLLDVFSIFREVNPRLLLFDLMDKRGWMLKGKKNNELGCFVTTYGRCVNEAKAWEFQNPGFVRQFGKRSGSAWGP